MQDEPEAEDLQDLQEDEVEYDADDEETEGEEELEEDESEEGEPVVEDEPAEEEIVAESAPVTKPYKPPYRASAQESSIISETAQQLMNEGFAEDEESANKLASIMLGAASKMSSLATGALVQSNAYYTQEVSAMYPDYSREVSGRVFSHLKTLPQDDQGTPHGVNTAIAMVMLQDAEDENISLLEVMKRHVDKMTPASKKTVATVASAPRRDALQAKAARLIPTASSAPRGAVRKEGGAPIGSVSLYTNYEKAAQRERNR